MAIIAGAIALRVALIAAGWPDGDSDEATIGLMARHIAYRGEHPAIFYGQAYMGALQAYLGAAFFQIFGPSTFALRLGLVALYALFLASTYALATLLYSRTLGLLSVGLLALGSSEMLYRQTVAHGGYLELLLTGSLVMLLAGWLALTQDAAAIVCYRRYLAYGAWGLAAGIGIWSHPLVVPFVSTAGLLLVAGCRRELWSRAGIILVASMLIGAGPFIAANLDGGAGVGSGRALVGAVQRLDGTGFFSADNTSGGPRASLMRQAAGTLLVSLPLATGANALAPHTQAEAWPLEARSDLRTRAHTAVHAAWGIGGLACWAMAVGLELRALRRWSRCDAHRSPGKRRALARRWSRLALLVAVGGTLGLYLMSQAPAFDPWSRSRYLTGLLIAAPAVLAPLWERCRPRRVFHSSPALVRTITLRVALTGFFAILLLGSIRTFEQLPAIQRRNRQQEALVTTLLATDTTRVYSEYWTCNRLMLASAERIACANLDDTLAPALDRYAPARAQVAAAPAPAFVFPLGSAQATRLAERAGDYTQEVVGGYVIYRPVMR